MSTKITHKFASGLEVSGTFEEIAAVATALGQKLDLTELYKKNGEHISGYYPSESKGLIKITDMQDFHIRRALLKRAKEYYSNVFDAKDENEKFLMKFVALVDDRLVKELFLELQKRATTGSKK
jgi:hypothetical protein